MGGFPTLGVILDLEARIHWRSKVWILASRARMTEETLARIASIRLSLSAVASAGSRCRD
ncbi:hypothetical protein AGR3A_Lc80022 [Agrobacterium tomkonis CFBP 6623]|uniref:Uncharacterized protein n=1 Tax=Agrobacterium tomkonis CFBP 6623 TaxID=1183432 RepID=A0A1S7S6I8_9HYPH|nr:hypothetical protein ASD85_22330 [Rhizobium sp. Root651]CUX63490.1 hypothetical protein AGR3A_Lc80022 [Agrobacterium tomkonis CFBP 6623]